jgi:hypothetical protein
MISRDASQVARPEEFMSKKAFDIFFAVGAPSRRSTLWRACGTRKGDVFLKSCEVDSDFKLSLHPPDDRHPRSRCHHSFATEESWAASESGVHPLVVADELPEQFAQATGDGYGRFDDVWEPSEIAPRLVMPFRIGLPDSELRPMRRDVLAGRPVRWLPAPGDGRTVEVAFMIADQRLADADVRGAASIGNRLLLRHEFSERRALIIVWRSHKLTQEEQMWVVAYGPSVMSLSPRLREDAEKYDYHRVVVEIRDEAYQSRAFIDTAVE